MSFKINAHTLLALLEARPVVGGLEVSDVMLRFVASASPVAASVRLEPGIVAEGRILDPVAFGKALIALRAQILGPRPRKSARINVVVSLSSVRIYSQVFALPFLEGENLEKAVELNLKMALPGGAVESYSGWQVLTRGAEGGRIEILAAFLDKGIADDLTQILRQNGFSVLAIESRALALARLARQSPQVDSKAPAIVVSADASGLDVIIVRAGNLQFNYFNSWKDLQNGERQMTLETFRAAIVRSVTQILNFYTSHWKEPVGDILVAATGMRDEIIAAVTGGFSAKARELVPLTSPPLTADWFVALGSALRGRLPRRNDSELSLLGINAREEFRREQVDHFLSFWRLLAPLALGVLAMAFFAAWLFLIKMQGSVERQAVFRISPGAAQEIKTLRSEAQAFNESLALITAVNAEASPKASLLRKLFEITGRRGIAITRLQVAGSGGPVSLSGSAPSEDVILGFKNELNITPGIRNVALALTDIQNQGDHYSFSLSFVAD